VTGTEISKMRVLGIVALGAAVVLIVPSTHAATANCSDATDTYNSAISDVSDALKRYTRCLSSSNGVELAPLAWGLKARENDRDATTPLDARTG
jgi:hypothetical protein